MVVRMPWWAARPLMSANGVSTCMCCVLQRWTLRRYSSPEVMTGVAWSIFVSSPAAGVSGVIVCLSSLRVGGVAATLAMSIYLSALHGRPVSAGRPLSFSVHAHQANPAVRAVLQPGEAIARHPDPLALYRLRIEGVSQAADKQLAVRWLVRPLDQAMPDVRGHHAEQALHRDVPKGSIPFASA